MYPRVVHPAVALRYPFLSLEQAAHFLDLPIEEARARYDRGLIPPALRSDGGLFEPTPGLTLIPYLEFRRTAPAFVCAALDRWQSGELSVPLRGWKPEASS